MTVKGREDPIEALSRSEAALREAAGDVERARAALESSGAANPFLAGIAARTCVSEAALLAFAQAAGELLGETPLSVEAARRAGLIAAAGHAWENELGPLLSSGQVRELLGDVSRQRVGELLRNRRLIGLRDQDGRRRFPAFQFHDGRPVEALVGAYWTLARDGHVDDWTAASWLVSSDEALDGASPVRWAREGRDPEQLARVARRDAARLAQ
jgi:hypothetical protein